MAPERDSLTITVVSFLAEMRAEHREDIKLLSERMEEGFEKIGAKLELHVLEDTKSFAAIDKRLSPIENRDRVVKWLGASVIVALLGAAADFFKNHFPFHP